MLTFQSADSFITKYPQSSFNRIRKNGFALGYAWDESNGTLVIKAFHGEDEVAEADFADDGIEIHCNNVTVEIGFQRKGIATAMYVMAEVIYGKKLWNYWKSVKGAQSLSGQSLWNQPNRPFGQPEIMSANPETELNV